ncbi:MAG TPA: 2-C-methyl-D-erythritol 4-phosphate cytidylyltransferase [Chromatiales bacterium]|nr:2-C-methyl-D-erythritol 4-phosphate cytidylyltransferase [Chromatiales bacterium]HEX22235.1 2-C-methyl-D-erythritol 4-phosphate cytidylyltransferase [Chromatiales bacterium]
MTDCRKNAEQPRCWAVIPAAGVGVRMQADRPKQYLPLLGKTVIEYTLQRLLAHSCIGGAVVAISSDDCWWPEIKIETDKPLWVAEGGDERCHSVLNALQTLSARAADQDWVLVHDAARPCLRSEDIDELIHRCAAHPVGGLLAVPVKDTLKRADAVQNVLETVDRNRLWHAQTPQMFRLGPLRDALQQALAANALVTDEASAMERAGQAPLLVEGHADNIKITHPEDLAMADLYLKYLL